MLELELCYVPSNEARDGMLRLLVKVRRRLCCHCCLLGARRRRFCRCYWAGSGSWRS